METKNTNKKPNTVKKENVKKASSVSTSSKAPVKKTESKPVAKKPATTTKATAKPVAKKVESKPVVKKETKKPKTEVKSMTLKEIRRENKVKRKESEKIRGMRSAFVTEQRNMFKDQIKLETDKVKRKEMMKEYKYVYEQGNFPNDKGNIIDIKGLNKYYCNGVNCEHILHDVDLEVKQGSVLVILGASGSGKSTLLNIISGLTEPTQGEVIVANKNLTYLSDSQRTKFRADNLSFVFQSYNLIPTLTVTENIKVGEDLRNKDAEKIDIDTILDTLDLKKQAKKYPFQMSGGQNQRVSIGRALAKNPKILFADEPTGALDEEKGREALQMLLDINKKHKTTIIMVTHNPNFAKVGDMVIRVKDGRIAETTFNTKKLSAMEIEWS